MTRQVRFGILGAGRIAQNRVGPAMHAAHNAVMQAAASRDPERARALGAVVVHATYDALLNDPDVEAVYVSSHNGLHRDLAIAALEHGKHVLCEKPLGRTAREVEEMIAASQSAGRLLAEAFMYRHHPQLARVQALVREGTIGALMAVEASFRFHLDRENDVRWVREWGGGALMDVGCYCVNVSRLFLGDVPERVRAIAAMHPAHGVDMSVQGALEFPGGRFAVISCGFESGLQQQVTLVGTAGTIRIDEPFISRTDAPTLVVRNTSGDSEIVLPRANCFQLEVEDLARAILDGGQPLVDPSDALANLRVLERIAAEAAR